MTAPTQSPNINFINDDERSYFAEAVLGEDVRAFLTSSTGRLLHGRATAEYDKARNAMFELDPYTPEGKREYTRLKAVAWSASHFLQWVVEAMQNGNNAEVLLNEMRKED